MDVHISRVEDHLLSAVHELAKQPAEHEKAQISIAILAKTIHQLAKQCSDLEAALVALVRNNHLK